MDGLGWSCASRGNERAMRMGRIKLVFAEWSVWGCSVWEKMVCASVCVG